MPQGPELIIILIVILLLFGGAKLPKLARSLGQAQNEFKRGLKDGSETSDLDATGAEPVKKRNQDD
jgi:sec-independent protein translocase protein TatA